LPSGHVAAATALYCSAILISAPQWRPVVAGLGFVGVAAIGASALAAELSGLFGVIAGILITLVWACAAAILMARSPIAAKREELRPDTAAIAFSRHRSIRL
jgi:membrane-associated phospholipid phosphatase